MKKMLSAIISGLYAIGSIAVVYRASTVNMHSSRCAIVANAGSDYDDGEEYSENGLTFSVYPEKAVLIYCDRSKQGTVKIPSEIKGVPVTIIAAESFYNCRSLTLVTIPDSVKEIEEVAFYGCSKLTSVEIPASVSKLGYSAFFNCTALEEVNIKNPDMEIGEGAFEGTKWLQNNITDVEENGISFRIYPDHAEMRSCTENNIEIPNKINGVKVTAIQSFGSANSAVIPASVKTISSQAIGMYCSLDKITVDEGNENFTSKDNVLFNKDMTTIFYYPASKSDTSYEIPDTVTTVSGVFSYCNNLKAVTIPNSVKTLKNSFYSCEALESVTIPDSVTELESDFNHCTSLKTVNIPASVESFGPNGSFSGCPKLKLVIDEKNVHFSVSDGLVLNKDDGIVSFALEEAKNVEEITIPDGAKNIWYGLFSDFTELKKINFPDTIERIGDTLCDGCTSLETVTLPESVRYIGWNSFANCTSLTSVTILNPDCFIYCGNYDDEMPICNKSKVYTGKIVGYDNSTAQKYAEKFNLTFESLGTAPVVTTATTITTTAKPTTTTTSTASTTITETSTTSTTTAKLTTTSTTSTTTAIPTTTSATPTSTTTANNIDESKKIKELEDKISALERENAALKEEVEQLKNGLATNTFGDIDGNNMIDGRDASMLLTYYAKTSTGYTGTLKEYIESVKETES